MQEPEEMKAKDLTAKGILCLADLVNHKETVFDQIKTTSNRLEIFLCCNLVGQTHNATFFAVYISSSF